MVFSNLEIRNKSLPQSLKDLKSELELSFDKNISQAGVINPGYFSFFLTILEKYRLDQIISKYHISEEQYTNGLSGELLKIPVVDVFLTSDINTSTRIFITSATFLKNQKN